MEKLSAVIFCLFLTVRAVTAQKAQSEGLPQWLTGIIAVIGFLFLCFVSLLVKKAWCEEPSGRETTRGRVNESELNIYDTNMDMTRIKEDINTYENVVIDNNSKGTCM
ncbi:hypothetical protein PAMP_024036 [Pampus punctatissimus]